MQAGPHTRRTDPWSWTAPVLLVAIFATLLVLCSHAGLLGIPAALIVGSWFLKYAFVLLDHVAHGHPGLPVLTAEQANPLGETRPLAYALLLGVGWGVAGALGAYLGAGAASALRLGGLLLLPAVIAAHVAGGRLGHALRPGVIAGTVRALGPAYLVVLAVAVACGYAARGIAFDAAHHSLWLRLAVLMSLWLTMFGVLGAAIHRRRFELGFEATHSPEREQARVDREVERRRQALMDQLFAESRAGPVGNAWATLERRLPDGPARIDDLEWVLERASAWPDPRFANRVAAALVTALLDARRTGAALDVVRARLRSTPGFGPAAPAEALRIAELARAAGDRATARAVLDGYAERYPGDPSAAVAASLRAELERR
jgi:hypothetical protein